MKPNERAARALSTATRYLARWEDRDTCCDRDDLVQETAIATWRQGPQLRHPRSVAAFVRTVARRRRFRALTDERRWTECSLDADPVLAERVLAREERPRCIRVAGDAVTVDWLIDNLDAVLTRLSALNGKILMGFYEGASCADLAARFDLPVYCIKVRLHRSRQRVRREFEGRVRDAARSERG